MARSMMLKTAFLCCLAAALGAVQQTAPPATNTTAQQSDAANATLYPLSAAPHPQQQLQQQQEAPLALNSTTNPSAPQTAGAAPPTTTAAAPVKQQQQRPQPSPTTPPPTTTTTAGSTNFLRAPYARVVKTGQQLLISDADLSQLADMFVYSYSPDQPFVNQAVGYALWPSIVLEPNASVVLRNVRASYFNPSVLDECAEYSYKLLTGLQGSLGPQSGTQALNATAVSIKGPAATSVLVNDGSTQATVGEASASFQDVTFNCLPNPNQELGSGPIMGPAAGGSFDQQQQQQQQAPLSSTGPAPSGGGSNHSSTSNNQTVQSGVPVPGAGGSSNQTASSAQQQQQEAVPVEASGPEANNSSSTRQSKQTLGRRLAGHSSGRV